jgi:hypothetical protein
MIRDPVYHAFLTRQSEEARALAATSDLIELVPLGPAPADRYLARFGCTGLVRRGDRVLEAGHFEIGIWFPTDYLRRADPAQVLTWLGPFDVFHPNISHRLPFICIGRLSPGTALVDLVYQCFEIITWQKVTMREDDALNPGACGWAREHRARLPVDRRPLKWRRAAVDR